MLPDFIRKRSIKTNLLKLLLSHPKPSLPHHSTSSQMSSLLESLIDSGDISGILTQILSPLIQGVIATPSDLTSLLTFHSTITRLVDLDKRHESNLDLDDLYSLSTSLHPLLKPGNKSIPHNPDHANSQALRQVLFQLDGIATYLATSTLQMYFSEYFTPIQAHFSANPLTNTLPPGASTLEELQIVLNTKIVSLLKAYEFSYKHITENNHKFYQYPTLYLFGYVGYLNAHAKYLYFSHITINSLTLCVDNVPVAGVGKNIENNAKLYDCAHFYYQSSLFSSTILMLYENRVNFIKNEQKMAQNESNMMGDSNEVSVKQNNTRIQLFSNMNEDIDALLQHYVTTNTPRTTDTLYTTDKNASNKLIKLLKYNIMNNYIDSTLIIPIISTSNPKKYNSLIPQLLSDSRFPLEAPSISSPPQLTLTRHTIQDRFEKRYINILEATATLTSPSSHPVPTSIPPRADIDLLTLTTKLSTFQLLSLEEIVFLCLLYRMPVGAISTIFGLPSPVLRLKPLPALLSYTIIEFILHHNLIAISKFSTQIDIPSLLEILELTGEGCQPVFIKVIRDMVHHLIISSPQLVESSIDSVDNVIYFQQDNNNHRTKQHYTTHYNSTLSSIYTTHQECIQRQ